MSVKTSLLLGAVALVGATMAAHAQQPYQPYAYPAQPYAYYQGSTATPPSWS
jgi:hypothetical protein